MEAYKSYITQLSKIIKKAESDYFIEQFNKAQGNVKKSWKVINSIRCKSSKLTFPNYLDINSTLITNRRVIINKFNNYFVNVASNLNDSKYGNVAKYYSRYWTM